LLKASILCVRTFTCVDKQIRNLYLLVLSIFAFFTSHIFLLNNMITENVLTKCMIFFYRDNPATSRMENQNQDLILSKWCPGRSMYNKYLDNIQHMYVSISVYTCYKFSSLGHGRACQKTSLTKQNKTKQNKTKKSIKWIFRSKFPQALLCFPSLQPVMEGEGKIGETSMKEVIVKGIIIKKKLTGLAPILWIWIQFNSLSYCPWEEASGWNFLPP